MSLPEAVNRRLNVPQNIGLVKILVISCYCYNNVMRLINGNNK